MAAEFVEQQEQNRSFKYLHAALTLILNLISEYPDL